MGVQGAGFGMIPRGADRFDFVQAQQGVEGDKSGINMLTSGINDFRICCVQSDFSATAHIGNLAFVKANDPGVRRVDRIVDDGSGNPDGFGLGFAGAGIGLSQDRKGQHQTQTKKSGGLQEENTRWAELVFHDENIFRQDDGSR